MLAIKVLVIARYIAALVIVVSSVVAGSYVPVPLPAASGVLDTAISSCDQLIQVLTTSEGLDGVALLRGEINCATPVTLHISKDVVIMGEGHITLRNVHIVVDPGAQLGLVSSGHMRFSRDEALGWNEPLLAIEGDVFFEVVGGGHKAVPTTQQGVIAVFPSGSINYQDSYSYAGRNSFSVVVSEDVLGGSDEVLLPSSVRAVGEAHQEIRSCGDLVRLIKDSKAIMGTLSFVGPIVCDTPQTLRISSKATLVSDDNLVTKNVHVVVDSGAELVLFAKKAIRLLRDEGSSKPLMTVKGDLFIKAGGTIPGGSDAEKASAFAILNGGSLFSENGVFSVERDALNFVGDDLPRSLRAGESAQSIIVSVDGRTAIWPTVDGSIVFGQVDNIKDAASESAILVAADKRKKKKVETMRRFLREEREGSSTEDSTSKGGENITRGWFIRSPRRRLKEDIDTARAHEGEVVMSLDDRGCVEVTVDGLCVTSKSGKYRWEWLNRFPWRRRRSSEYEVAATPDGMQVTLGDKLVWGVTVEAE